MTSAPFTINKRSVIPMPESVLRDEFHSLATELRRLAYTMPAGHEDRLIELSERMVQRASQF